VENEAITYAQVPLEVPLESILEDRADNSGQCRSRMDVAFQVE
jgi:hypothetical protein